MFALDKFLKITLLINYTGIAYILTKIIKGKKVNKINKIKQNKDYFVL